MDYFVHCLEQEGIYVYVDLLGVPKNPACYYLIFNK